MKISRSCSIPVHYLRQAALFVPNKIYQIGISILSTARSCFQGCLTLASKKVKRVPKRPPVKLSETKLNSSKANAIFKKELQTYKCGIYAGTKSSKTIGKIFQKSVIQLSEPLSPKQLQIEFNRLIDASDLEGKIKWKAKGIFEQAFKKYGQKCRKFSMTPTEVKHMYRRKKIKDKVYYANIETQCHKYGACNIAYEYKNQKVGVVLAANSGLPGGALGKENKVGKVKQKDCSITTQEESVWANIVLSKTSNLKEQKVFHDRTIREQWGLIEIGTKDKRTRQRKDFTKINRPEGYNEVFVVEDVQISPIKNRKLQKEKKMAITAVFADGPNGGDAGTPTGTMQRTRNQKAAKDDDFFKECIKVKIRSTIDAMVANDVDVIIMAKISCKVYCPKKWQGTIEKDVKLITVDVLNEIVGPNGEPRGSYIQDIVFADVL